MSLETEFLWQVTDLEDCPEFNYLDMEIINNNKYLCLTYADDQINGVYIFRPNLKKITTLWTLSEEILND